MANEPLKINDLRKKWLPPREGEQLRGELGASPNRLKRVSDAPVQLLVAGYLDRQHFEVAADHLQKIIEIMGDPARQLAKRFRLLRLAQLRLGRLLIADIDAAAEVPRERASAIERGPVVENFPVRPIRSAQAVHHREWPARIKGADVSREAALKIIEAHALGPAVPQFLLHRPAGEIEPGLVEPIAKLVRP
jgi:hypothetical protein